MLSLAGEVIKSRSPKEALKGVLLKAEPDHFSANATDLETWVSQTTKVVQVDRAGVALVSAERLQDVVKAMTDDAISLEQGDDLMLHVRGAKTHFKLLAMKPTDFPPIPAPDEATPVSVKATDLRQMVNQTVIAAASENGQYAKAAVLFRLSTGKLELVAGDGRRLAVANRAVEVDGKAEAMVPTATAKMLLPLLKEAKDEETVSVSLSDRQAVFEYDGTTIATQLLEGSFPNFDHVTSQASAVTARAKVADLLSAVRQAMLLSSEDSKGVKFSFSAERGLVISGRNPVIGEAKLLCECQVDGAIEIGLNPAFLADALKVFDADEVSIGLLAENKPAMLRAGTDYLYGTMPVKLASC